MPPHDAPAAPSDARPADAGQADAARPLAAPHAVDLGLTTTPEGPRLRVLAPRATSMECCLLDRDGRVATTLPMHRDGDVFEVTASRLAPGARYALRAAAPDVPRHAPIRDALLLDPCARHIENLGTQADPRWCAVAVADEPFDWSGRADRPRIPLRDVVVYEAHVRGLTKLAPFLPEELRGTYAGLASDEMIERLLELGITSVELLPIHAIGTERFLRRQGLPNFWGYSTLGFFAPHAPYASAAARAAGPEAVARELKGMVRRLHEAGLEVYLDVVYNHTAEQGPDGTTSSFRGLDDELYYRHDEHGAYLDVTGCGNSLDTSQPAVRQLILDSLAHWVETFRIDGFRFDLAAALGRDASAVYRADHPLFREMAADPRLADVKLIAEPWDCGMGGWQTGAFPAGWSEWNDRYRDRTREFWVRDLAESRRTGTAPEGTGELATCLAGSSDLFADARGPLASVNFVTAHDGFTLRDLVSYNAKHNLMNAELGRDGTNDNRSWNFGIEGPDRGDERIARERRLAMRNLLGTLALSAGVPMLTAGDEMGRTQQGNNNAYNQDSEIAWVDWDLAPWQLAQRDHVSRLLEIRRAHPTLRPSAYNHGDGLVRDAAQIDWFDALGRPMTPEEWNSPTARTLQYLSSTLVGGQGGDGDARVDRVLVVIHGLEETAILRLPHVEGVASYTILWDSVAETVDECAADAGGAHVAPLSTQRITGPSLRIYRPNPVRREA